MKKITITVAVVLLIILSGILFFSKNNNIETKKVSTENILEFTKNRSDFYEIKQNTTTETGLMNQENSMTIDNDAYITIMPTPNLVDKLSGKNLDSYEHNLDIFMEKSLDFEKYISDNNIKIHTIETDKKYIIFKVSTGKEIIINTKESPFYLFQPIFFKKNKNPISFEPWNYAEIYNEYFMN